MGIEKWREVGPGYSFKTLRETTTTGWRIYIAAKEGNINKGKATNLGDQ